MKNILFMSIKPFLPLAIFKFFAQAPPGQPQNRSSSGQGLEAYSLPKNTITENELTQIKSVIQQVLDRISEPVRTAGKKVDYLTIRSNILAFQGWLKAQGCISQASTTYNIETPDKYSENIFFTFPGQLPFDITFNMEKGVKKPYRLLIFVDPADLFNFASLVENKTINGVPALKNWPSDYLEKRLES